MRLGRGRALPFSHAQTAASLTPARPRPNRIEQLADILAVSKLELLNTDAASSVADVVRQSRERIAAAVGIASDRVRIAIEL